MYSSTPFQTTRYGGAEASTIKFGNRTVSFSAPPSRQTEGHRPGAASSRSTSPASSVGLVWSVPRSSTRAPGLPPRLHVFCAARGVQGARLTVPGDSNRVARLLLYFDWSLVVISVGLYYAVYVAINR